jgi:tripartite-type tricarboxylate transporter receptor subunit TctC
VGTWEDGVRLGLGPFRWLVAAAALLAVAGARAAAQDVVGFFAGRTIKIVVGFGPGGGYDLYARLLARYLPAHLPGAPSVVVENMDGAGSVRAANYVYEAAPRDGSVIAAVNQNAPMYQLLGGAGARFRAEEASHIGSLAHSNELLYVWHTSGITSLEQAKAREVVLGAVAVTSDSYIYPTVINGLLGTRFRIVNGYTTGQALNLAVERGEVMGRGGTSWASIQSSRPTWMRDKAINILVQVGPDKETELAEVPLLADLVTNDDDGQLLGVISLPLALGYSYWLPPGVPAERVAALREAFAATAADKKLLEEAATRHIIIRPQAGAALDALVRQTAATPKPVIEKAVKLLGWK